MDDAIHLRDATEKYTLCAQPIDGLNVRWSGDPFPNAGDGCWTCLRVAQDRHYLNDESVQSAMDRHLAREASASAETESA